MTETKELPKVLYRVEIEYDLDSEYCTLEDMKLVCTEYPILSYTRCGYWIQPFNRAKRRFILASSIKAFAYPTEREAMDAFIIRKKSYLRRLQSRMGETVHCLSLADKGLQK